MNRPGGWRWLVGIVTLVVGLSATGCTAARNSLGTSDSGCYVALPSARAALHRPATFQGVRLVSVRSLRHIHRLYGVATESPARNVKAVCLVAFTGHFTTSTVTEPHGRSEGSFAVVVVEYPDNHLLGTLIFSHVPVRFAHTHIAG
jgi:hypothetical protein